MRIIWLGHDSFKIENKKRIYIDPYEIKEKTNDADILLITHGHYDHSSKEDILKVVKKGCDIITTYEGAPHLKGRGIKTGETIEIEDIKIKAVDAYNINKFKAENQPFHPKGFGIGFIIEINGNIIYHAGDTDNIPEMKEIKADIALLPVSGIYTMTAEEAVEAVKIIKPRIVIPMHFGGIVGSLADAEDFKRMIQEQTNTKVVILKKGEEFEV
jgi:L-ascorbate metabolism protein UlaG (beta-lactamase superfamily)